jgi:putative endonuclease
MDKNLNTSQIGKQGEELAGSFLVANGYEILKKNYRFKKSEIDIIAKTGNTLVIVEVKLRKNSDFGNPEDFVSDQKAILIHKAAVEYINNHSWEGHIRFDIVAICGEEIQHFEDAF